MTLAESYAHVLHDASKSADSRGISGFFDNFIGVLKREGHTRLLPAILRAYELRVVADRKTETCTLICAREADVKKYKRALESFSKDSKCEHTETVIDENIIGGYILRKNDVILDNSYKKNLLMIYRNVTL